MMIILPIDDDHYTANNNNNNSNDKHNNYNNTLNIGQRLSSLSLTAEPRLRSGHWSEELPEVLECMQCVYMYPISIST